MAIMLAASAGFGWMPSGHSAGAGMMEVGAGDIAHPAAPAGRPDRAPDGCCGAGLAHASDSGQCSFHCAPAIPATFDPRPMPASVLPVVAEIRGEGSSAPTPFRPPVA